jgi:hypothetical protein
VSGSSGTEAERLGEYCLREFANYANGLPLENEINLSQLDEGA